MPDNTKLVQLRQIIADRDRVIEQARREVIRLEQACVTAQSSYAQAVSEGDESQGSKLARLQRFRQEYQDALVKLEAVQESVKQARTSEKLNALCAEVEEEARDTLTRLDEEKSTLIERLRALEAQVLEVGSKVLAIEQQQQSVYTQVLEVTKAIRGRKATPKLPGPGTFIDREIPFRQRIQAANRPVRQERPWRNVGPRPMLINR